MNSDRLRQTIYLRADIVREIERRVPIETSGRDFRCQCPRHQDATDPLYIDSEKRTFTCFGCGWSGDVVDFIAEHDGTSAEEAIEALRLDLGVGAKEKPEGADQSVSPQFGGDISGLARELNLSPDQVAALLAKYIQTPTPPLSTDTREKPTRSVPIDERGSELAAICSPDNLLLAWRKVKAYARDHDVYFDSKLFELYEEHLDANLHELVRSLSDLAERGQPYEPGPFRHLRITKPKGGFRDIAIMSRIEDRIVVQAILNVLAPRIEKDFSPNSFGHRLATNFDKSDLIFERWPELWGKYQKKLRKFLWTPSDCAYVKGDIAAFYDKVDRVRLHDLLSDFTADDWTLGTLDKFLEFKILLDDGSVAESGPYGIPQGPAYAHFLANLYLHKFDRFVEERIAPNQDELIEKETTRFFKNYKWIGGSTVAPEPKAKPRRVESLGYCRYVDDFFILFRSRQEAENGKEQIRQFLEEWHLEFSPEKTTIHDSSEVEPVVEEMRSRKYTLGKLLDNDENLTVDQREALYEVVEKDFLSLAGEEDLAKASGNIPFIVAKLAKSNYFQRNEQNLLNLVIELLFSESFKHSSMGGVLKRIIPHVVNSHLGSRFAEHLRDPATPDFKRVLFLQAVQENRFYEDLGSELQDAVREFLTHACFFVRFAAANCLWANGIEIAHQELRKLYKGEKNHEIKGRLLHLLRNGGSESPFATFLETASKDGIETNYHALLAARKSRDALSKVIRRAWIDRDNTVFVEWLHAILRHGGREAMNALNKWTDDSAWTSCVAEAYRIILARAYDLYQAGHVTARSILELIENLHRLKNQRLREILSDGLLLPLREKVQEEEDEEVREKLIEYGDKAIQENRYIGPMLGELPPDAAPIDVGFLGDVGLSYRAYRGNGGNQLDIWEFVEVESILKKGVFPDAYGWQDYLHEAKRKGFTDFHDCEVLKDENGKPAVVRVHYRLTSEHRRIADIVSDQPLDERRQAQIVKRIQYVCVNLESIARNRLRAPTITPYNVVTDVSGNVKMIGLGSSFCRPRYTSLERTSEVEDAQHSDSLFLGRLSFEMLTGKCPMKEAKRLRAEGGTDRYLTHSEDLKSASIFHTRLLRRLTYEFAEYRAPLRDPHLRRLIQDYPVKLEEMKRLKDNGVSGDDILRWQLLNFADMRLADVWRNPRFQKDRLETRALNAWLRVMDDVEHFCRSKSFALGDHSDIVHCPETGMHLAASGVDLVLRKLEYLQSAIGTERDSCTSIRFNVALMHVILRYEALASAVAWKHSRFDAWSQGEDAKSFLKMQEKARFLLELLGKSGAETTPIDRSRLEPLADALKITLDGSQQTEPFSGCGLTALAVFVRLMAGDDEKAINAEQLLRRLAAWEKRVDDCLGNRTRLTMAVYRDLGEEQKRLWDILQGFALGRSRFYGVMKDDMGAMTTRSVSVEVEGETLAVAPTMVLALTSNPLEKNLAKGDLVSVDVMDGQVVALSNLSKTLVSLFPEPEIDEGTMKMGFKENIEKAIFSAILLRDLAQINDHFPNAMSSSEYDIVFERTLDILNETLRTSVSLSVGRNLSELKIPNMKSYPEAVGFLTLLLMNHPDADRSSSNNLDVSIFGSILQLAQEKADSESTELLRMLQSIMIEKCWAPEDFKQDTGRSFYLFLEYWYRLRAVVLLQMSSYAFFFPHPMQRLLYNLRERLQHCLNHLQLEETEEIRKITSGIIELLLDPDQDVFQIIEDEIKSQIAEVERFIEESRYKVSVHEVILEPERLFLSLFDQSLDETGKSTTKAWKGILRKTDAQQQDLHAHQQTDQKQPQETEEPFQFYQDGDFWVIRYEGRTIPPIKKIDGLFYLSVLLARQSHGEISPLELQSLLHPPSTKMDEKQLQKLSDEDLAAMSVHVESGEPQLAPEQLREIRARRQGYQEEIEEWEAQGNEKMAAEVREKADQLDSYLKSAVGLKGRVRKTSKLLENSRTTVKNSVKRALEKIKHHDMPLYLHLLNHVKTGHGCSYHPDRPIPWKTEKTS